MKSKQYYWILVTVIGIIFVSGCAPKEIVEEPQQEIAAPVIKEETEVAEEEKIEEPEEPYIPEQQRIQREPKEQCTGGRINFDHPPFNLDKIIFITPLGAMSDGHVTPTDHQYWSAEDNELVEVYSPGDGFIIDIERMGRFEEQLEDWRVVIEHTCTIGSIYIHIDALAPRLKEKISTTRRSASVRIPVEEGEVIGWYDFSVDYNVVDEDITIGLLSPKLYEGEDWKIHTQDPFLYFNEPLKSQLEALSLRVDPPLGGKIDYDIDGKLIGNWFVEGTAYRGSDPWDYWKGHLSISPHHIDPTHFIVSMGDYGGEPAQFGVKGNSPNPADVGVGELVKYELTDFDYYDGNKHWDRVSLVKGLKVKNDDQVKGIALFELVENRKLKFEVFPEKLAEEVSDFAENAKIYER
ncbi:MAG: hypothetical protein IH934_04390 [Nanoarchaeota archaeon]|nr:hypothetical protein [Nanoarchaeota archaeon]